MATGKLPHGPPHPSKSSLVFVATVCGTIGGVAIGAVVAEAIAPDYLWEVALSGALILATLVGVGLGLGTSAIHKTIWLGGGAGAGLAAAGTVYAATTDASGYGGIRLLALFITVPVGGLLGLFLALLVVPVVSVVQHGGGVRAVEAIDRVNRTCGLWLACVGLFLVIISVGVVGPSLGLVVPLICSSAAVVGLSLACVGEGRRRARLQWLARVRAGSVMGWTVVARGELDDVEAIDSLPAFLCPGPADDLDSVLVQTEVPAGQGTNRQAALSIPWALLSLDADRKR